MMNKNKMVLGRGLDALINPMNNDDSAPIALSEREINKDDGISIDVLAKIQVTLIEPNPYQPRTEFDPEALTELKKSILENGLIQPITVRRTQNKSYQLISGERRLRAFKEIGYREIPAYIIKVDSNEAMLALALIENIQREQLNAIEVARAYKRLMDECSLSQEEIAEKVGKNRSTVTNSIRLLKLPKEVQDALVSEIISAGHARALINLPNQEIQLEILEKIIKNNLNVRKVETLVKEYLAGGNNGREHTEDKGSRDPVQSYSQRDIESKLRGIFGTKVNCRQKKDGSGEITFEFYSNDELERLFELFHIIQTNNN